MSKTRLSLTIALLLVLVALSAWAQDEPAMCPLTIVYDNEAHASELTTDWGFSCFIDGYERTILFDTGQSGPLLRANLRQVGVDASSIDTVFLSHNHADHVGGFSSLIGLRDHLDVWYPQSVARTLPAALSSLQTNLFAVSARQELCPGVWTTGEFRGDITEQALVLQTNAGLVLITGCAHPGILRIVDVAASMFPEEPIDLVMGGFHLLNEWPNEIRSIARELREMGVQRVAPTHCSGAMTRIAFAEIFGNGYLEAGVGWTIELHL